MENDKKGIGSIGGAGVEIAIYIGWLERPHGEDDIWVKMNVVM